MDFDLTQVLEGNDDDYLDDTEVEDNNSSTKRPVGHLKVFHFNDFPETSFPIYEGDNFIGRDERCNITIPTKPVSKKHACIQVQDGFSLLYDCNSRNKTKKQQILLKPEVRYELKHEDQLMFADVSCQYLFEKYNEADDEHSLSGSVTGSVTGSEAGSESMLPDQEIEDDRSDEDSRRITSSPKLDLNESPSNNLVQSKGVVSPLFCPETDEETDDDNTDDERDSRKKSSDNNLHLALHTSEEDKEQTEVNFSLVVDQTLLYSQGTTGDNKGSIEDTLPVSLEPDSVPVTPGIFAEDGDTSLVLKRAVDVRCDPLKRLSIGNTLDYGLETLENPNFSRESADISGGKDDSSRESSPMKKLKFLEPEKDDDKHEIEDNVETTDQHIISRESIPKEELVVDDLMATQVYEMQDIPESPGLSDEGLGIEQDVLQAATQVYGVTSNESDQETLDDMPTLAYEAFNEDPVLNDEPAPSEETGDELATQAYGLTNNDRFPSTEEATQIYGHEVDDSATAEETDVDETDKEGRDEDADKKSRHQGHNDNQALEYDLTQIYGAVDESFAVNLVSPVVKVNVLKKPVERKKKLSKVPDSDSESAVLSNAKVMSPEESSDSSLPTLASFLTTEKPMMDSDEDFLLPERRSSRKRPPSKTLSSEAVLSDAIKPSSIVTEGENSLSSVKRCYVEHATEEKPRRTNKMAKIDPEETGTDLESTSVASSGRGKTRGRGRRTGTREAEVPTKRGRRGRGRREIDEIVEVLEQDEKEKTENSKEESIVNEVVEEMMGPEKEEQMEKEDKEQVGSLDENKDSMGYEKSTTKKKKPSLQRNKKDRKGTIDEMPKSEAKQEAEDVVDKDDNGGSKGRIKDTKGMMKRGGKRGAKSVTKNDGNSVEENGGDLEEVEKENTNGRVGKSKLNEDKDSEDGSQKSERNGKMGRKKNNVKEKVEEDDLFKFDDHEPQALSKKRSTSRRQTSKPSPAISTSKKKSGIETESPSQKGRKGKQNLETPKQGESSEVLESFCTPEEPTVSPSQRSRRSSTCSETSLLGMARKRGRAQDKKGQQEDGESPVDAPVKGTPRKRTKLEPKTKNNVKVMFTGLTQDVQARKIVEDLQGEVVESVYECTHLVTDKVRRTVKFLCALSRGIPVVNMKWLQACKKSKSIIDCLGYTVKDKASEKQYEFSLESSLEVARTEGLLEGYQIHVTPSVVPKAEFMKDIIQCAKGKFQATIPKSYSKQVIIISCEEDRKLCPQAVSAGHVHTSELILTGVLRQQLDLNQYKICEKEIVTPSKKKSRRK